MCITAAIVGGAGLGAGATVYSSKKATKGAKSGIAEQQRQFDITQNLLAPQRQLGNNAMDSLSRLYGYGPVSNYGTAVSSVPSPSSASNGLIGQLLARNGITAPMPPPPAGPQVGTMQQGAPDMSGFFASPDYQFRRNEGIRDIQGTFSARGGSQSGNALRALAQYNSNLASGEFNNYTQRLLQMAGLGGAATSQGAQASQNTGANVATLLGQAGNARASGITGVANAIGGGLADYAMYRGYRGANPVPPGIPRTTGNGLGYGAGAFDTGAAARYFPNPFGGS